MKKGYVDKEYNFGPGWVKVHDSMNEAARKDIKKEHTAKSRAIAKKMKMPQRVGSGMSMGEHTERASAEEKRTGRDYVTHRKLPKGHKEVFGY
jgi:hypothetical protein